MLISAPPQLPISNCTPWDTGDAAEKVGVSTHVENHRGPREVGCGCSCACVSSCKPAAQEADSQRPQRHDTAFTPPGPRGWKGVEGSPAGPTRRGWGTVVGRRADLLRAAGQPGFGGNKQRLPGSLLLHLLIPPPRTFFYSKRTRRGAEYKKVGLSSSDDLPTPADSLIMAPQMSVSCEDIWKNFCF